MTSIDEHDDECKHGIYPLDVQRQRRTPRRARQPRHFSTIGELIRRCDGGGYVCADHAHDETGRR